MRDTAPRILFATDFSEGSDVAAEVALAYARRLGAALHVLHVTRDGLEDQMARALGEHVLRFAGVPVTAVVESGSVAERTVRYAQTRGIDLIVLGTHGRTGFTRALLGSMAERVARTASCPVMTVPPAAIEGGLSSAASAGALTLAVPEEGRSCLVCQAPCDELICESCRAQIRGEALQRKLEEYQKVPL